MTLPMHAPARYFPVTTEPLRMKAGLYPFGTDFGNGPLDGQFFQVDRAYPDFIAGKAAVSKARHRIIEAPEFAPVHEAALRWLRDTVSQEHPGLLPPPVPGTLFEQYDALLSRVQEDASLIHRGDGTGRALLMHVCFPSGWRPEVLGEASFMRIHAPVPGFAGERLGRSMIDAMIDRGPFVRFVWTVAADDVLDHHPIEGRRAAWTSDISRGWLRVERQITVPLREVDAALFLIRTYLYPLESLTSEERRTLALALERMPEDVAAYKGLLAGRARMLALLR